MNSIACSSENRIGGVKTTFSSLPAARMLVSFFPLSGVHDQIVVAIVEPDDHSFVHLFAGTDAQPAAFLQTEQRVSQRRTLAVRNQDSVRTLAQLAFAPPVRSDRRRDAAVPCRGSWCRNSV